MEIIEDSSCWSAIQRYMTLSFQEAIEREAFNLIKEDLEATKIDE